MKKNISNEKVNEINNKKKEVNNYHNNSHSDIINNDNIINDLTKAQVISIRHDDKFKQIKNDNKES